MAKHNGAEVEVVRDAEKEDVGFKADEDQVLIRLADGTTKVVPRSEVTEN